MTKQETDQCKIVKVCKTPMNNTQQTKQQRDKGYAEDTAERLGVELTETTEEYTYPFTKQLQKDIIVKFTYNGREFSGSYNEINEEMENILDGSFRRVETEHYQRYESIVFGPMDDE